MDKVRCQYKERSLPKSHGGTRRICVPPIPLRILQDKLLRILTLIYAAKPCVTGFVLGRSVANNANPHVCKQHVLTIDLDNFFPSIHFGRVRGILQSPPYGVAPPAASVLAQLACHDDGHLPQGAPTSPIVANMVCGPLDSAMLQMASNNRLTYTRYADDITLSTNLRTFPSDIVRQDEHDTCEVGVVLRDLLAEHGFTIREGKTRLRSRLRRQTVTGLVVNEVVNVRRSYVRQLRALIHSCSTVGLLPSGYCQELCIECA
ncbi:MAG: RNA-directed DNA polymerase [Planctomycetes bacterium]|nr:RNA-directed DNA polymerase [Planctomycetota bacterium]